MTDEPKLSKAAADEAAPSALLRLRATACHEAGHAVMAVSLGRQVHKVTIEPGKSQFGIAQLGLCRFGKGRSKPSNDVVEDEALILLAGMVAEARFTGRYCQAGASQDLRNLARLLQNRAGNERQRERLERRLLDKTEHLLGDAVHAKAIELVAQELIKKTTISGRTVRHLFQYAESKVAE